MTKILDIETTVFEQLKDNEMTIGKICTFAHLSKRTVEGWNRKEPKSIADLKKINHVIELTEKLNALNVGIELKDNCISLSTGGWQEFTEDPIHVQVKDICKTEMEKSNDDDYIGLLVKIVNVCR